MRVLAKIVRWISIVLLIGCSIIVFAWAVLPNFSPDWTGFGQHAIVEGLQRQKTLWDWFDLLLVPVILASGAWYLNYSEKERDKEREIERAQQSSLDSYLDFMKELLLDYNLRASKFDDEARIVATSRTVNFISTADEERRGVLLQFLFQSNLINRNPIIDLLGVDLKRTTLDNINLLNVEIKGAYFCDSHIRSANLENSVFIGSDFSNCDLSDSVLSGVDLSQSNLQNSIIRNVDLRNTILAGADLSNADLRGSLINKSQLDEIIKKNLKGLIIKNASNEY